MSIKIISFIFSLLFFLVLASALSLFFLDFSSKIFIDMKKNEIKSYANLLKNTLEDINIDMLNNNYFINIMSYLPEYSYFIIFDKDYDIVYYFPYYFEVDINFIKQYKFEDEKVIINSKNYLITYFTVIFINNKEYGLALEMNLSVIKDFRKNIINLTLYLIPFYIILSVFFSYLISKIIQSRLNIIRDFSVKVALGNFHYNIDYKYKDELEDVFRSIKIMKNNLINLINDLNASQKLLQNILNSIPFTVFLINDKITIFNNPYNLDINNLVDKIIQEDILDYKDKKFKIIKINIQKGKLVIILDFTEIYEIERTKIKFLSEISHDLRTPLATAKSILSNMENNEIANKVIIYLDKVNHMINRYLNFSKIKMRKIDINKSLVSTEDIEEMINDIIFLFTADIKFKSTKISKKIEMDIQLFQQMIFNIIDNAQKNSDIVLVEMNDQKDKLEIKIKNQCTYDKYKEVKEIFYGLKESKGLGLNIIKEISDINNTPVTIDYEEEYIVFTIKIKYASDSF